MHALVHHDETVDMPLPIPVGAPDKDGNQPTAPGMMVPQTVETVTSYEVADASQVLVSDEGLVRINHTEGRAIWAPGSYRRIEVRELTPPNPAMVNFLLGSDPERVSE